MLEISRTDIINESLMNFDSMERFIKLPIEGYLDLLGIEPNKAQISLFDLKLSLIRCRLSLTILIVFE